MPSLPYEETPLIQLLSISSFLLALNITNTILDRALYCGLVGQVFIGVAWGTPGAGTKLLSAELQENVVQLGYLGLILMVFEGGAATRVDGVRRDLWMSALVAVTGVAAPLGLGWGGLTAMLGGEGGGVSNVQCFAAGAALASTSLGTTFAVLSASGLVKTRLGSVLGTAAMMDDVVGLVMVQIVASFGGGEVEIDIGQAVIRPVLVSLGFAVLVPVACRFVARPFLRSEVMTKKGEWWSSIRDAKETAFVAQTALLIALVVSANYAGASVLLAAYLAGIVVSWWGDARHTDIDNARGQNEDADRSEAMELTGVRASENNRTDAETQNVSANTAHSVQQHQQHETEHTGTAIYDLYYSQPVARVLKPFFFASIGFSIPISDMFSREVIWRGIIYSILMAIGKMICGLWLVRFSISASDIVGNFASFASSRYQKFGNMFRRPRRSNPPATENATGIGGQSEPHPAVSSTDLHENSTPQGHSASSSSSSSDRTTATTPPAKPLSLYPAAIVSSAMVARGEIGFLISAVAESNRVFRRPSDGAGASALFLIVTWAIVLCTIIGPISVGLLVRRVKKLEGKAAAAGRGTKDVLGVWGVQ